MRLQLKGYDPDEIAAIRAAARVENGIIVHPILKAGLKRLRMHQARSLVFEGKAAQPSHLLMITGEAGAGKSTLLKTHAKRFDSYTTQDGMVIPTVLVEMPAPCTRKALVMAILGAMGHSASEDWRTHRIIDEIANLVERHQVWMIMLDEADRIFGQETDDVAKFLVSLLNRIDAQIVLAGAPQLRELNTRFGLKRRMEEPLALKPYRWDHAEGQANFRALLKVFDAQLGLDVPAGLDAFDLSKRIYVATGGHVGLVSKLLVEAVKRSLETGAPCTKALLGAIFAGFEEEGDRDCELEIDFDRDVLKDPVKLKPLDKSRNPFLCSDEQLRGIWSTKLVNKRLSSLETSGQRRIRTRGRPAA